MSTLLAANGQALNVATDSAVDPFIRNRSGDIALPSYVTSGRPRWIDAADYWPDSFTRFQTDGTTSYLPFTVRDTFTPTVPAEAQKYLPETTSPFFLAHGLIVQDIGIDDNFELNVRWDVERDDLAGRGYAHQVGPCFGVDMNPANQRQMGVLGTWDVSLGDGVSVGATYWHNVFRTPTVATCNDNSYYDYLGGGAGGFAYPTAGVHWWRVRCVNGYMELAFDGVVQSTPIARPSWTNGRTLVGIHAVGFQVEVGRYYASDIAHAPGTVIATAPAPGLIMPAFSWRPYDTPVI